MQLFIILALLLYGGKNNAQNLLQEVKPMLETFGGDGMKEALKSAEEISQVISAVGAFSGGLSGLSSGGSDENRQNRGEETFSQSGSFAAGRAFPLAPISDIADRDITYSLSKYISQA